MITVRPGSSAASCFGVGAGAVGHGHPIAEIEQRRPDRPRRTAGAEDQSRAGGRIDPWARRFSRNPQPSVLLPLIRPFSEHQCVHRAGAPRGSVHRVAHCEGGALVRDGHVDAGEPRPPSAHGSRRGNRSGSIGSGT